MHSGIVVLLPNPVKMYVMIHAPGNAPFSNAGCCRIILKVMAEPALARSKAVPRACEAACRILWVETGVPDTSILTGQNLNVDVAPDLSQACRMLRDGLHDLVVAGPGFDVRRLECLAAKTGSPHSKLSLLLSKLGTDCHTSDVKAYLARLVDLAASAVGTPQTFALLCDRVTGEPDWASVCTQQTCSPYRPDFLRRYFEPSRIIENSGHARSAGRPPLCSQDDMLWLIPLIHESHIEGLLGFVSQPAADESAARGLDVLRRLTPVSAALVAAMRDADALRRTADELEAVLQINSHLISNVCHEFRSMLAAVRGYSKRILEGRDGAITDPQRDDLMVVLKNTNKLLDLVSHSLPFVAEQRLRVESLDLREAWRCALQRGRHRLSAKSVTIHEETSSEPLTVAADPQRLAAVFEIILANAIQCTASGAEIGAQFLRGTNGEVTARVIATGDGLPADLLERTFDHQNEPAPSGPGEARLTGLSLVHDMVWLHGGRMGVMSTPGEGTVFVVTLPPKKPG
jgi:signal transduction histidine kinase